MRFAISGEAFALKQKTTEMLHVNSVGACPAPTTPHFQVHVRNPDGGAEFVDAAEGGDGDRPIADGSRQPTGVSTGDGIPMVLSMLGQTSVAVNL